MKATAGRSGSLLFGGQLGPVMTIGYEDVQVSEEVLQELQRVKKVEGFGAYAQFKTRLYYGNLRRRQLQGLHELVEEVFSSTGFRTLHCICGLYFQDSKPRETELISREVQIMAQDLNLDEIQKVRGHRSLEDFKSITFALLIKFLWEPKIGDYLWTAFCQECGESIKLVINSEARAFVAAHDKTCSGGVSRGSAN